MKRWKLFLLCAAVSIAAGCGGGGGGGGSRPQAADTIFSLAFALIATSPEDAEPVDVENAKTTAPEDSEPEDVG